MKAHETGRRSTLRAAIVALMGSTAGSTFSLALRDTEGEILCWFHVLIDIDGPSGEAQLAGEKRLLEMWPRIATHRRFTFLVQICRRYPSDCYCGGLFDRWSGSKSGSGRSSFRDSTIRLTADRVSAGRTVRGSRAYEDAVSRQIGINPLWQSSAIRPLALAHGLRSHWSTQFTLKRAGVGNLCDF